MNTTAPLTQNQAAPSGEAVAFSWRRPWLFYLALATLTLLILLPPAIWRPLQASDEGRYAETARETLAFGDWLIPHLNQVPHLTKSALYYDLVALCYAALGVSPFSARVVSIAAFLAALLFTAAWAGRRAGGRAAFFCAAISLTMIHPVGAGEFGDLNMLLTMFLTIGLLLVFDGLERPEHRAAWYWGWAFTGLAFLAKGPPALMIPAGTLLLYRWISGRKLSKTGAEWGWAVALFCIFGLPWYVWLLLTRGKMLWDFWVFDVAERTGMNKKDSKSVFFFFFYPPVFLACSTGWGVFLAWLGVRAVRWRRRTGRVSWWGALTRTLRALPPAEQFLFSWVVVTIVIFSALRSEMITYIQPAYPAAALLLSLYLARRGPGAPDRAFKRMTAFAAVVTLCGLWGVTLYQVVQVRRGDIRKMHNETVAFNMLARAIKEFPSQKFTLVECYLYNPSFSFLTGRLAALCEAEVHPGWPAAPGLSLTRDELRRRMASPDPLMVIIKRSKLERIFPAPRQGMHLVAENPDYVLLTNMP